MSKIKLILPKIELSKIKLPKMKLRKVKLSKTKWHSIIKKSTKDIIVGVIIGALVALLTLTFNSWNSSIKKQKDMKINLSKITIEEYQELRSTYYPNMFGMIEWEYSNDFDFFQFIRTNAQCGLLFDDWF